MRAAITAHLRANLASLALTEPALAATQGEGASGPVRMAVLFSSSLC